MKVNETLKKMKNNKIIGANGILIEVWNYLGEFDIIILIDIFNKI